MFRTWWTSISNYGCNSGLQAPEQKRIRLTNQSSMILAALIMFYALIFSLAGSLILGCVTIGVSLAFLSILLLNRRSQGALSVRYFFLFLSYSSIFIFSLMLGRDTGIQLFFVSAIASPFVVLDVQQKRVAFFFAVLPIALLIFLEIFAYEHWAPLDFPPFARRLIYLLVLPSVALTTFLFSGYFFLVNQHSENALNKTIQDLHKSRRLIEEQQVRLANASRLSAVGELSGSIAHEINNPLAIILGYTEQISRLLQFDQVDHNRIAFVCEKIIKTINRITKIVLGLRKLAREGGEDPMELANLAEVIEDATSVCTESLDHAGINLRIKLPTEACLCTCRTLQISQVLLNLIQNAKDAIQALEEKWIEIEVQSEPDHYLVLVKDSGHITDPEILQKIGQPFFTTKPPGKGTGLGLSISRKIVASHGGRLDIDKEASSTTFVVQLPRTDQGLV